MKIKRQAGFLRCGGAPFLIIIVISWIWMGSARGHMRRNLDRESGMVNCSIQFLVSNFPKNHIKNNVSFSNIWLRWWPERTRLKLNTNGNGRRASQMNTRFRIIGYFRNSFFVMNFHETFFYDRWSPPHIFTDKTNPEVIRNYRPPIIFSALKMSLLNKNPRSFEVSQGLNLPFRDRFKLVSCLVQSERKETNKDSSKSGNSASMVVKKFSEIPERDKNYVISGALFLAGIFVLGTYIAVLWDKGRFNSDLNPDRDGKDRDRPD